MTEQQLISETDTEVRTEYPGRVDMRVPIEERALWIERYSRIGLNVRFEEVVGERDKIVGMTVDEHGACIWKREKYAAVWNVMRISGEDVVTPSISLQERIMSQRARGMEPGCMLRRVDC